MADNAGHHGSTRSNLEAMAAVLRGYVAVGGGESVNWDELLSEDCVYEDWSTEPIVGRERIVKEILAPYRSSFAGQHHVLRETIVDAERLVVLGEFHGRFVGAYLGIEPTGSEVSWAVRDVWTFREGDVVRIDIASDTKRVTEQMGVDEAADSD